MKSPASSVTLSNGLMLEGVCVRVVASECLIFSFHGYLYANAHAVTRPDARLEMLISIGTCRKLKFYCTAVFCHVRLTIVCMYSANAVCLQPVNLSTTGHRTSGSLRVPQSRSMCTNHHNTTIYTKSRDVYETPRDAQNTAICTTYNNVNETPQNPIGYAAALRTAYFDSLAPIPWHQ